MNSRRDFKFKIRIELNTSLSRWDAARRWFENRTPKLGGAGKATGSKEERDVKVS